METERTPTRRGTALPALDPIEFRGLMDKLRDGLGRAESSSVETSFGAFAHDPTPRLTQALLALLHAGQRTDMSRPPAFAHVPDTSDFADSFGHLAGDVRQVADALGRTIAARFGAEGRQCIQSLLATDTPDFLGILGKSRNENAHSDVLRWILDPNSAENLAPLMLRALFARLPDDESEADPTVARTPFGALLEPALASRSVSVRREHALGTEQKDRIDILIAGAGFLVAIENKIDSSEHEDQTITYATWMTTRASRSAGLFLSPTGGLARSHTFVPISYLDLLEIVVAAIREANVVSVEERAVVSSYLKTLSSSVLRELNRIAKGA